MHLSAGGVDMISIRNAFDTFKCVKLMSIAPLVLSLSPYSIECSDVELANLFIEADADGNGEAPAADQSHDPRHAAGLLEVDEFQRLMRRFYREVQVHRKDLWLNVLQILESAFAKVREEEEEEEECGEVVEEMVASKALVSRESGQQGVRSLSGDARPSHLVSWSSAWASTRELRASSIRFIRTNRCGSKVTELRQSLKFF